MFANLMRWAMGSEVLRGSAAALGIKVTAAVTGFIMFALLSRHLEPAEFGELAIIFNAASFLAVVSLCGQETLIQRSWNEYCDSNRPALARGALSFGLRVVVAASLVTTALVAIAWQIWDPKVPMLLLVAVCLF